VTARRDGHPRSALAGAAKTVGAVYESPFLAHVTMEPMNWTVHVRKDGCEVWTGSQVLSRARAAAAEVTGFPLEKVVVHNHLLGGGFGRRLEVDYVTQAVRIAKQVEAPVKVVWTREEDLQHDVYRPSYYDRIAAGLDPRCPAGQVAARSGRAGPRGEGSRMGEPIAARSRARGGPALQRVGHLPGAGRRSGGDRLGGRTSAPDRVRGGLRPDRQPGYRAGADRERRRF